MLFRSFNPSLGHLSSILLSYVAVSMPRCLSEFYPYRGLSIYSQLSLRQTPLGLALSVRLREVSVL